MVLLLSMLLTSCPGISRGTAIFPAHYPTSVLLGCVDLVDCINQAQFHAIKSTKTPEGKSYCSYYSVGTERVLELLLPENDWLNDENESEWLYVCTNPRALPMPLAVSGEHKLCTSFFVIILVVVDLTSFVGKLTKKIHTAAKTQLNLT